MELIYDHPRVPTVYRTHLPDKATEEEIAQAFLMLARDAHARPVGSDEKWLAKRVATYGTIDR
jgi:hypothetical protein